MADFDWRIIVGLPKPETAKDTEAESSLNGMRAAIERTAYRDSALIRQCLETARIMGLSGEDTYVLLAYHALRRLEDTWQELSKAVSLQPRPPLIIDRSALHSTDGEVLRGR